MTTSFSTSVSVDDYAAIYAAATPGEKARMRTAVTDAAMAAVMSGDMDAAAHYGAIRAALVPTKSTPTGPDYVAIASDMAATLEAAASMLRRGVVVNVNGSEVDVRATEPGTVDSDRLNKLIVVPVRAARSANGAVAAFIAANVTDTPRTIAQILAAAPVDGYRPSTGAIGACLVRVANGTEEVDGFAVADVDGRRGAVAI